MTDRPTTPGADSTATSADNSTTAPQSLHPQDVVERCGARQDVRRKEWCDVTGLEPASFNPCCPFTMRTGPRGGFRCPGCRHTSNNLVRELFDHVHAWRGHGWRVVTLQPYKGTDLGLALERLSALYPECDVHVAKSWWNPPATVCLVITHRKRGVEA